MKILKQGVLKLVLDRLLSLSLGSRMLLTRNGLLTAHERYRFAKVVAESSSKRQEFCILVVAGPLYSAAFPIQPETIVALVTIPQTAAPQRVRLS